MEEHDRDDILPTARIFWAAHYYKILATYTDRYELECTDGFVLFRNLPRDKVGSLKHSGDLTVEPFYFDVDGKVAQSGSKVKSLSDRPAAEVRRIMVAYTKAKLLQLDYKAGKVLLSETPPVPKTKRRRRKTNAIHIDAWMKLNRRRLQTACRPFYLLDPNAPQGHEEPRLGQSPLPSLGSISTLKKDRAIIARPGFVITDLGPDIDSMRNGGRRMAADMEAFVKAKLRSVMLRPERMKMAMFRRHLAAELKQVPSLAARKVPRPAAIERIIGTLENAKVIAAYLGIKKMGEVKTIFTEGPRFNRVGALVLMDCWTIDLVVRLNEDGGWLIVTDADKEEWGVRRRLRVCVALDACSRAVLGFAMDLSENTDVARRALRMVLTDKTLQALDSGCEGPLVPPVKPEAIYTDVGPAFQHEHFAVTALDLTSDVNIGPKGAPHLRGMKEKFFKNVHDGMLAYATGTTHGNVVAKGDYDAMGRASVEAAVLGQMLFTYFNDVYNLSAHRGLENQPPIDRFREQFDKYGAATLPSIDRVRVIFGVDVQAPVTRQGVCVAGNQYYSGHLAGFFRDVGQGKPGHKKLHRVKVDPCDLGRISIFLDGAWQTLEGPARMRGVGLTDWLAQCRSLALKHGQQAAVHADTVARALLKIERMGTEARMKSQVRDMSYDSKEVATAVSKIRLRVKEQETASVEGAMLGFDSSSTEGSFETAGEATDFGDDAVLAVDDEYADEGRGERPEDLTGLDGDDVDLDGEPLERDDAPSIPDFVDDDTAPAFDEDGDGNAAPTPEPAPAATIEFIKLPPRKG